MELCTNGENMPKALQLLHWNQFHNCAKKKRTEISKIHVAQITDHVKEYYVSRSSEHSNEPKWMPSGTPIGDGAQNRI